MLWIYTTAKWVGWLYDSFLKRSEFYLDKLDLTFIWQEVPPSLLKHLLIRF